MMRNELPRTTPESVGLASRDLERFIDALEQSGTEMHGLMILRHGKVAAEGWWAPYAPGIVHGDQSLSKTYAATAVGFLFDEGLVSLEEKIVSLFPEYVPADPDPKLSMITVRDVLRMGCGMTEMPPMGDKDWVKDFLAMPIPKTPGKNFFYNSIGSSILCAIVRKRTGKDMIEFLRPRLFDVIGIDAENLKWIPHPDGTRNGGGGLFSTTEDNARLALLYLNKGVWKGKRVLSKEWIRQATSLQLPSAEDPGIPDCRLGYGFQMWMCRPKGVYRFDGAYGQYAIIFPDLDMVVAINETAALGSGVQKTLDIVWDVLMPMVGEPLAENPDECARLRKRLNSLALPKEGYGPYSPKEAQVSGRVFILQDNDLALLPSIYFHFTGMPVPGIRSLKLDFHYPECLFTFMEGGKKTEIKIGLDGTPRFNEFPNGDLPGKIYASGYWPESNVFEADFRFVETCFKKVMRFTFDHGNVTVTADKVTPAVNEEGRPLVSEVKGKAAE